MLYPVELRAQKKRRGMMLRRSSAVKDWFPVRFGSDWLRALGTDCGTRSRLCATTASAGGSFSVSRRPAWRWPPRRAPRRKPGDAKAGGKGDKGAPFPKDFVWGVATAAYQVEGAANEDGTRPVGLGRLLQEEGRRLRGQHRRRRLRPLPPLQGRRRADEDAGREVVPLQRVVAARAAERRRRGQPQGARLLQPPARRAGQARHRADVHDLPLGLPARRCTSGAAG